MESPGLYSDQNEDKQTAPSQDHQQHVKAAAGGAVVGPVIGGPPGIGDPAPLAGSPELGADPALDRGPGRDGFAKGWFAKVVLLL
jgi:hypothetical protein